MIRFCVLISNCYIAVDSKTLSTTNCMTDEIDFYLKVDFILEFLKKRSLRRARN